MLKSFHRSLPLIGVKSIKSFGLAVDDNERQIDNFRLEEQMQKNQNKQVIITAGALSRRFLHDLGFNS